MYPLYFLILVIIIDKIFLLDFFEEKFLQKGNPVFYLHRKILFQDLKKDESIQTGKKKLAVALGDSRSYPFSNPGLPEEEKDKWEVYNFSGPQAVPMYSLFWYEKFIQDGIVPDLVYLSLSPEGFDDSKGLIYDPFLRLGADHEFREKYWSHIPFKDRYSYYMDKLFVFRSIQFDYKLFLERYRGRRLYEYNPETNEDMLVLKMGKGEYLAYAAVANVKSKLKKDAKRIQGIYLNKYKMDETQFFFVEELLKIAKENGSRVFVVWPRVYEDYRKNYEDLNLDSIWWERVQEIANRESAIAINYNEDSEKSCDLFNDASHQSVYCFQSIMEDVFSRYRNLK